MRDALLGLIHGCRGARSGKLVRRRCDSRRRGGGGRERSHQRRKARSRAAGTETMNAPNPSPADRDLESLRRAQRAHEPSMEEILASIRSIIADDREPRRRAGAQAPPPPARRSSTPTTRRPRRARSPPRQRRSRPRRRHAGARRRVACLAEGGLGNSRRRRAADAPEPRSRTRPRRSRGAVRLGGDRRGGRGVAFEALSTTLALQSSAIDRRHDARNAAPDAQSWLDDNLPSLVERLVRAEIQRVARGGR